MPKLHPTAIVDSGAELADDVEVGPFSIIENNVEIGSGTSIHSHVLIAAGARIGRNCAIHHGAAVGTAPQDLKFKGEPTVLQIGDHTVIREFCDLNRGTVETGKTVIGQNVFLMAYTHVAHDCGVGDHVILANGVQLAGHVNLEEYVIVGGLTPIHQFCTIGAHAFIGGRCRVSQDVPPYILAAGDPLGYKGLNVVGLKRRGFEKSTLDALHTCYRLFYQSKLNRKQALDAIRSEIPSIPEVESVISFIERSERGIIR